MWAIDGIRNKQFSEYVEMKFRPQSGMSTTSRKAGYAFAEGDIFNHEIQNFGLENRHMMNTSQPFCWWMSFTKVSNPFFP